MSQEFKFAQAHLKNGSWRRCTRGPGRGLGVTVNQRGCHPKARGARSRDGGLRRKGGRCGACRRAAPGSHVEQVCHLLTGTACFLMAKGILTAGGCGCLRNSDVNILKRSHFVSSSVERSPGPSPEEGEASPASRPRGVRQGRRTQTCAQRGKTGVFTPEGHAQVCGVSPTSSPTSSGARKQPAPPTAPAPGSPLLTCAHLRLTPRPRGTGLRRREGVFKELPSVPVLVQTRH